MDIYLTIIGICSLISMIGFFWLVITGFRRSAFWGVLVFLFSPLTALIFSALNWYDAKRPFLLYIIPTIVLFGTLGYMVTEIGTGNLSEISRRMQTGELKPNELLNLIDKAIQSHGNVDIFKQEEPVKVVGAEQTVADGPVGSEMIDKGETGQPGNASPVGTTDATAVKAGTDDQSVKASDQKTSGQAKDVKTKETAKDLDAIVDKKPSTGYPIMAEVTTDPLIGNKKKRDSDFTIVKFENIMKYKGRYFVIYTKKQTYLRGLLVKVDKNDLYLNRKLFGGSFKYRLSKKKIKTIYMLKKEFVLERDKNRLPEPQ